MNPSAAPSAGTMRSHLRFISSVIVLAALLYFSQPLNGQTVLASGPGGGIPDATSMGEDAGNPNAGVFTSDIVLNAPGTVGSLDFVRLQNFSHTYAGDLVFQLTHVDTGASVLFL